MFPPAFHFGGQQQKKTPERKTRPKEKTTTTTTPEPKPESKKGEEKAPSERNYKEDKSRKIVQKLLGELKAF